MSASPSSFSAAHSRAPSSGYRLRPVRVDPVPQPRSVSPSPPPPSAYSAGVVTPSSARMPPPPPMHTQYQHSQALPPLAPSPTSPDETSRPWSPPAGVREIDAAPPPRRVGLPPPPTGHELMSLFPAPSPSSPPTYAAPPNSASGSGSPTPGAPQPIVIPTSGWFINEERMFFAREGKEIIRLKREEPTAVGSSGSGSSGPIIRAEASSVGLKREREGDRERDMVGAKRTPPVHSGCVPPAPVPPALPSSSYHASPTLASTPQPSHTHSQSASHSQPQQPFLTLVQSHSPYRQPPPPPPRDREPVRDRERGRETDGDIHMHSTSNPPANAMPQPHQGRGTYVPPPTQHGLAHTSPPPPPMQQGHGHSRGPSYGAPPPPVPQQHQQQYTYTHSTPPPPGPPPSYPHPQPIPPHMRGSYTHPPPPPPTASRGAPSYSVQPPSHPETIPPPSVPQAQVQPVHSTHPTYSAVPLPSTQHPPPPQAHHQQAYSASPPTHAHSGYAPDPYARDHDRGHEAYPSPSPSRDGYPPHPTGNANGYSEGYMGGGAYLAGSERRRAGKHTRRVVVKA